jgi:Arc/MetJ-type ribon-helix-helix transcriptional regulator
MTLTLDPATEQRLQQELATGRYREPSELIAHLLDLAEADRDNSSATKQAMNDWLLRNKATINTALDESFAAKARGESYSAEEAAAMLAERRAARIRQAA